MVQNDHAGLYPGEKVKGTLALLANVRDPNHFRGSKFKSMNSKSQLSNFLVLLHSGTRDTRNSTSTMMVQIEVPEAF